MKSRSMLLVVIAAMLPCLVAPVNALERRPLEISQQLTLKATRQAVDKAKLGGFIADGKTWSRIWGQLQPGKNAPKVDFKKSLVLIHIRDAADPNRHRFSAAVNEGDAQLMALSTRIGFQRSDNATITFHEVPRQGIKAVKSWDAEQRKIRVQPVTASLGENSARVTVHVILPGGAASFAGRTLDVRLYEYDPLLADVGATLVDQIEKKSMSHQAGKETKLTLQLGQSAQIKARRSYYVTLFFLDGNKRTHMGEKNGERGLAKVLTDSKSRSLKMIVRQVN